MGLSLFSVLCISTPGYGEQLRLPAKLKSFFHQKNTPVRQDSVKAKPALPKSENARIEEEAIKSEDVSAINQLFDQAWDNEVLNPFKAGHDYTETIFDCSEFGLPVPDTKVISKFGMRRGRMHSGTDIKVYAGDEIYAVADGKVRFAKYYGGYGNIVIIRHKNGLETAYAHLSKINVDVNQEVEKGDCIGLGGRTGRATGTHLHFEIRVAGKPINPETVYDFANGNAGQLAYKRKGATIPQEESTTHVQTDIHVVASGETLTRIALKYGISVAELRALNRMGKKSALRAGQTLKVREPEKLLAKEKPKKAELREEPKAMLAKAEVKQAEKPAIKAEERAEKEQTPVFHKIQKGETLSVLSRKYGISIAHMCQLNEITPDTRLNLGQKIYLKECADRSIRKVAKGVHFVKDGDNLAKIARRYSISIQKLCELNGIQRNDKLQIGQRLKIGA